MKDSLRVVAFAAVLGVVCAGLLTGANRLLRDRHETNEAAERLRVVFTVLDARIEGVKDISRASSVQLLAASRKQLRERTVLLDGEETAVFTYDHPQAGRLRAIEFAGPGLWGPVEGLLCLRDDLATVFRISFYRHEETPGLGGEIDSQAFRDRFIGKRLGPDGITITKPGEAAGDSEVDGISGATMTCDKVQAMLKRLAKRIAAHRAAILGEGEHGG